MGERGYAHRVDIAGSVQAVWTAITESAHLTRWCAPDARIRARPGGMFRGSVDRVTEIEAHIDVFEPNRRIRLIYLPTPSLPAGDTAVVVDFILEPASPGGVILRVLGSGIPDTADWNTQHKRMRVGWSAALARLKVYVEKQMEASVGPSARARPTGDST